MIAIDAFCQDAWMRQDSRLLNDWLTLNPIRNRDHACRTDYTRCQASVEIDILAAKPLSLTLDKLQTIYRVRFPVMPQHEAETYYDPNGRIVFTPSKSLLGVESPRRVVKGGTNYTPTTLQGTKRGIALGWEDIRSLVGGMVSGGLTADEVPWIGRGRDEDYRSCWHPCARLG